MAARFDEGPEVAPQNFPEAVPHPPSSHGGSPQYGYQQPYQQGQYPHQSIPYQSPQTPKPEIGYTPIDGSTIGGYGSSPYPEHAQPLPPGGGNGTSTGARKTICGCSLLVLVLWCIICALSAAVIGLAAGTGVEAGRANNANSELALMSASLASANAMATATTTASGAGATATSFNDIDNGCSDSPKSVNGTRYNSFSLLGDQNFLMYCNADTPGAPLMSLFTADFSTCMDACSGFSKYAPSDFGSSNANTTCAGVSFIPLWTVKANATAGGAPGNCYLKPAPQDVAGLITPNIGTEVHAAILSG